MKSVEISTGAASTMSTDVETRPHTKIGSRLQESPGARIVITVASMFRPSSVIDSPTSAKNAMYASMPMFACSESGA